MIIGLCTKLCAVSCTIDWVITFLHHRTSDKLISTWQVWEETLFPFCYFEVLFIATGVYKFSNSLHKELQYKRKSDLSWKWVRCRSNRSKIILLKWEFFEKLAHFFGLVLVCSFSILSRWFLTLTNELIYIYLHVSKCFPETKNNPSNKTIYNILIIISPDV